MKIGGEGVEWKVENSLLYIKSKTRMVGYLNAEPPFDSEGWYLTNDLVDVEGDYLKIVGRNNDVVNVGGLKFLLTDVERVAYANPEIELAKVVSKQNPITGQHIEIFIQLRVESRLDLKDLKAYFSEALPRHMIPRKFEITSIKVGHRHKKL
jgi:acyl-CoA synthetase (AMP-forming)/AMP-acid ligase II